MSGNRIKLAVKPLTSDLWSSLEELFGAQGACNGCWCMYWRLGPEYFRRPREMNRRDLRRIVNQGPPPGLLAFDGERAVGWCQLTPRSDLGWLNRKRMLESGDHMPVWSISCFYVRRGYRNQGVMSALIAAALRAAKSAGAPALEAYPIDTAKPGSTRNVFTGTASTFRRLGFKTVVRRQPTRPIVRHDLEGISE
jgi:GNAT superfamily N-acetyltransferase